MTKKNKIHSTTQDFTEIEDIIDDVVIFKGKNACCVVEVSSVNFFLLSADEQNARIYGYMSLVNSLSFAIQILIISKRVDIGNYLKSIDDRVGKIRSEKLKNHLVVYRQFVEELVKSGGILDKKIYIIIPYSYLEATPTIGGDKSTKPTKPNEVNEPPFANQAKNALLAKRAVIQTQVERMGLVARPLQHEELIKLYYEIFNDDIITVDFNSDDIKNVIV